MLIKVSNYIAEKLVEEGIKHVFSVTGGGAMHLNDASAIKRGFIVFIIIMSRPVRLPQKAMREYTVVLPPYA